MSSSCRQAAFNWKGGLHRLAGKGSANARCAPKTTRRGYDTVHIKHGQSITSDGDAGSVTLHEEGGDYCRFLNAPRTGVGSKMYWKRSPQEVEDELLKLHAAGEIKLDLSRAGTGNPEDLLAGDVDGVICDALFRVQGFEGAGRQRTCPMCVFGDRGSPMSCVPMNVRRNATGKMRSLCVTFDPGTKARASRSLRGRVAGGACSSGRWPLGR